MLLHLCLGISAPAPLRWRASTPGAPRRAILPPRMGAENRMASHGLLYEGWGKEGMENLNTSCSVLDKGYEHEMNRYEITLMVARRAKEAAYQQTQDEDESLMTNAVGRKKQRLSHVMQAIREIEVESDGYKVEVRDHGRGIPLEKLLDCSSKINTGAKYDSEAFKKSVGLNGVGIKAVNALSNQFDIQSFREGETRRSPRGRARE